MTQDRFSLAENVVLITGASSGIGKALAPALAEAGAKVVAAARRVDRLEKLVEDIAAKGGKAVAVAMDVTESESIKTAFDAAERQVGLINTVINNAGTGGGIQFQDSDEDQYNFTMDTNLGGVWKVAQEAVRRMIAAKRAGSIVNVSSVLGLGGKSFNAAYCTSKGAVVQLTRAMAMDLVRHNIRVNALAPGWFVTEINDDFLASDAGDAYLRRTPARRAGQLEELIGPVIMLVSPGASFVNGVVLPVDGGHTAALI